MKEIGISSIAKLLEQYGPMIVILSVFLLIFLILVKHILNNNKKLSENEQELNSTIIEKILDDYFANRSKAIEMTENKKYDEKNIVDIYVRLNNSLKNVCEVTLNKTNSNRTAIYVFHNGSHASHGLPFFKMTCICEIVSKDSNMNLKIEEHSAMPLNLFDTVILALYNNAEYRITEGQTTDPCDLIFIKNTKLKDCFFVPIFDDENKMMGFIFNGYNTFDPLRDVEKEKETLTNLAMMAEPVIEFSKFQEYQSKKEE